MQTSSKFSNDDHNDNNDDKHDDNYNGLQIFNTNHTSQSEWYDWMYLHYRAVKDTLDKMVIHTLLSIGDENTHHLCSEIV